MSGLFFLGLQNLYNVSMIYSDLMEVSCLTYFRFHVCYILNNMQSQTVGDLDKSIQKQFVHHGNIMFCINNKCGPKASCNMLHI